MPGGVEALQSQQVQLRVRVVSDLMDDLEETHAQNSSRNQIGSAAIITRGENM